MLNLPNTSAETDILALPALAIFAVTGKSSTYSPSDSDPSLETSSLSDAVD
jgi:hypothetical protein